MDWVPSHTKYNKKKKKKVKLKENPTLKSEMLKNTEPASNMSCIYLPNHEGASHLRVSYYPALPLNSPSTANRIRSRRRRTLRKEDCEEEAGGGVGGRRRRRRRRDQVEEGGREREGVKDVN